MQTIIETTSISYEVKKSTFLSYLVPLSEFNALHVKLKNEHPKASHIVWAKRSLNEYGQIVENNSDDGEPKGTSGPPVLNVMRGHELIDVGILIVRYFGGIKLGTGGLVRAYGSSAKEVIAHSPLTLFIIKETISFMSAYHLVPRFEHYLLTHHLESINREFENEGVKWDVALSEEEKKSFLLFALVFEQDGFRLLTQ
ncbi:MAG: YigZ family protein [Campylobacteraceae bacterium]|nr:YigZ family protein [Campylobacteraceae bacterium]